MKFVCERCHTKYSIADDKVRGKVLKVRCKTCTNVITVRENGASIDDPLVASQAAKEAAVSVQGSLAPAAATAAVAPRPVRAELPHAAFAAAGNPTAAPPARKAPTPAPPPPVDEVEWYLAIDGAQTGPFGRPTLVEKVLSAPKGSDVHVWHADLDGWKPPKDVAELEADLARRRRSLTPAPPPPPRRTTMPGVVDGGMGLSVAGSGTATHRASAGMAALAPVAAKADLTPPPGTPVQVPKKNGAAGGMHLDHLLGDDLGGGLGALAPASAVPVAAAVATSAASVSVANEVTASAKGRPTKLIVGGLLVAFVVCGIVAVTVLRKPAPVAATVAPTKAAAPDFAKMAETLGKEEAAKATPPIIAPSTVETKATIAHVEAPPTKGGKRKKGSKNQPLSTSPPPVAGMTTAQREAASRFGEADGRELKVASPTSSAPRSTPVQGDISRVINNNRQGIQTCYQRALLRDNSLTSGKITVRVTVGLSGKVQRVSLDASAPFRALEPCIRDVMSRWAFPPSSEEYQTEFPVVLAGNQ